MGKKGLPSQKTGGSRGEWGDSAMVVYRGPIIRASMMPQSIRIPLRQRYNVSGASAGYLETYINTALAFSNPEFGGYGGEFKEYRVLGMRYEYYPWYDCGGYTGSSVLQSVGSMAPYHGTPLSIQGAVTTSSDQTVYQLDGSKRFHPCKNLTVEWRMNAVEEAQFYPISQSYSAGGIYGVVPTVTANRTYGTCFATFLVEFKGRT